MKTRMHRTPRLKPGTGAVIGFGLLAMIAGARAEPAAPRPNLLIIQTDEHNFRTLGCYRDTLPPEQAFMWGPGAVVETPHIDSIADQGALCTKFYATSPVCSPSRASFVSGQFPQNNGVLRNNLRLRDDVVTFAEILRRTGYRTGYAGKWHLDGEGKPQWAPARTFGFEDNRFMFNRGHWKQFEDTPEGPRVKARKGGQPTYDVVGADAQSFATDWLTDKAIEFVNAHRDTPFCYYLSLPDPHGPDTVRAPYHTLYGELNFERPRTFDRPADQAPSWASPQPGGASQSRYFGMVKCIDDNVGRILDALRDTQLLDRTIVVFTADHGDLRGEHHRHNKGVPLEASAKIPMLIRYPRHIQPGTLVTQALGTTDFLPTILGLMDVTTAGKEDGRDASALFTAKTPPTDWKDLTIMRGTGGPAANWLAAVTSRYKLIVSPRDPPWLIDMQVDPDELSNLCRDPVYRTVVRDLARELIAYGEQFGDARVAVPKIHGDLKQLAGLSARRDMPRLTRSPSRPAAVPPPAD